MHPPKSILLIFLCISTFFLSPSYGKTEMNSNNSFLFAENKGQIYDLAGNKQPQVLFNAQMKNLSIFLTRTGITYQFFKETTPRDTFHINRRKTGHPIKPLFSVHRVDMILENANLSNPVVGEEVSDFYKNFYTGQDKSGISDVKCYKKVIYKNIYDKIDWIVYLQENGELEYEFLVHPGGNSAAIRIKYSYADDVKLDVSGQLTIKTHLGVLNEKAPKTYQNAQLIPSSFLIKNNRLQFNVGPYDHHKNLLIDPAVEWSTYYGGFSAEVGYAVEADSAGNIYMADASESMGLASGGFQNNVAGAYDALLVKFNAAGARIWASYFGGPGNDWAYDCAIDRNNNIYLSGTTGSSSGVAYNGFQSTLAGNEDAFLVKFNALGQRIWATYYGGANLDIGYSCSAGSDGGIYMSGYTESPSGLGSSNGFQNNYGGGTSDAFLVKFDSAGNRMWGTYYGGVGFDYSYSCSADHLGNIYLAGNASGSSNIGFNGFQNTGTGADAFLAKFNAAGQRQWSTYYGGTLIEDDVFCNTDIANNVYLVGLTESPTNIASPNFQSTYPGGTEDDGFIAKFNASGNRIWGRYYGGLGQDVLRGITINSIGNVYIGGLTTGNAGIAFNGFQNSYGGGQSDAFFAKLKPNGETEWGTYMGGAGLDGIWGMTNNKDGIYGTGTTNSDTGISLNGFQNAYGGLPYGYQDAFLVKLKDTGVGIPLSFSLTNICPGATFNLPYEIVGTFNAGNNLTAQLSDVNGSFSTPINIGSVTAVNGTGNISCSLSNNTLTGSGYRVRIVASTPNYISYDNGYNLIVGGSINVNTSAAICSNSSLQFASQNLTSAGNYMHTFTSAGGCDSIVTLSLTVNPVVHDTLYKSICFGQSYLFGSQQITAAGSYTGNFVSATGCDSIVLLNLVVTPPITNTISASICQGQYYNFNNQSLLSTGTYMHTFSTNSGCDSIVTLNLVVNAPLPVIIPIAICKNDTFYWNSMALIASGSYTDTFSTANGCDSVVILNLTINNLPTVAIGGDTSICAGSSITLNAQNNGATYLWSTGATTQTIQASAVGSYSIQVTDVNGCKAQDTMSIVSVLDSPYVEGFNFIPIFDNDFRTIKFLPLQYSNVTSFLWQFGDGNESHIQESTHTYIQKGPYNVSLTVSNDCGNYSISQVVNVGDLTSIGSINNDNTIAIFPNPAKSELHVRTTSQKEIREVKVMSILGQIIPLEPINKNGEFVIEFPANIASGSYLIEVFADSDIYIKKISILK